MMSSHESFMQEALSLAKRAFDHKEVPVGAVIVCDNQIIARSFNTRESDHSPFSHAETKVVQEVAQKRGDWRLTDCTLYVTLEPCPMCLGVLFQARVGTLVYGCGDDKRMNQNSEENNFPSLDLYPQGISFVRADKLPGSALKITQQKETTLHSNNHNLKVVGGVLAGESSKLLKDFFKMKRIKAYPLS